MLTIDDLQWWEFDQELFDGCLIECPECKESTVHTEWDERSVYCEFCGDHAAMRCPACYECFNHVWSPTFKVTRAA